MRFPQTSPNLLIHKGFRWLPNHTFKFWICLAFSLLYCFEALLSSHKACNSMQIESNNPQEENETIRRAHATSRDAERHTEITKRRN